MRKEKLKQFWREWKLGGLLYVIALVFALEQSFMNLDGRPGAIENGLALLFAVGVCSVFHFMKRSAELEAERFNARREQIGAEIAAREEKLRLSHLEGAYSDEEIYALEGYIRDAFGHIGRMFYDAGGEGFRVDVAVSEPAAAHDFYTLTTVGMGAHRMDVPAELAEKNQSFAELTMLLPTDWDLMNVTWPFRVLQETERRPFAEFEHISVGNAYRGAMMEDSGFHGVLVLPATTFGGRPTRLMVPGGRIINFYLLLPIYEDEWDYIVRHQDSYAFWTMYAEHVGSVVVDPERESCLSREDKETEWNI